MIIDTTDRRAVATWPVRSGAVPFVGVAFSMWAATFAVGVFLHLWPGASSIVDAVMRLPKPVVSAAAALLGLLAWSLLALLVAARIGRMLRYRNERG